MNRGDRRERIFRDDIDREMFLGTLGEACEKTDWQIHAYCLMNNHFHLVVETPRANLVDGMKWLLGTYTGRVNRRHKEFGHLFSGRYKAMVVDGSGDGYVKTVCDYVHLNPARAGLLKRGKPLSTFRWSSYPAYLGLAGRRPFWLRVDRLLGEWGVPKDSTAGRRVFEERVEARRQGVSTSEFQAVERGWCLGREEFRKELLAQVNTPPSPSHYGQAIQEAAVDKAERQVKEGLKRIGLKDEKLAGMRKGAAQKIELARALRSQTTVSLAWIASRLRMGSPGYLAWLLGPGPQRRAAAARRGDA